MSQRESGYERIERDCYETPEWVTRALGSSGGWKQSHLSQTWIGPRQKGYTTMPKRPYPRHRRQHNAILVSILQNPLQTNKEIAAATGYSPSQVSRIVCSPEFQALYGTFMCEMASSARSKWLDRLRASG